MQADRLSSPHIVILGAGPSGLAAAYALSHRRLAQVTVLEQSAQLGGIAGSFELAGLCVDYGSHRLHRACNEDVLRDIRALLGSDLLDRPRHGRILLRGQWVHFPLKPSDLVRKLPLGFTIGVVQDLARRTLHGQRGSSEARDETCASVLERGLGRTVCRDFYFPYMQKLWGLEAGQLSATQARRRVSAQSMGAVVRKVLSAVPGVGQTGGGRFYYPRQGFGQICAAYSQAARESGAKIHLGAQVESVEVSGAAFTVRYQQNHQIHSVDADRVWATVPAPMLVQALRPRPPKRCLTAARALAYRGMILVYLVLAADRFTEFDAHYFPGSDVPISRLSEAKNYSGTLEPVGRTVLCAELPCEPDGPIWRRTEAELRQMVLNALETAGIPVRTPVEQMVTRRLRYAYPIYELGYETHLGQIERCVDGIERLLVFGRQGLFAHDNTHHALAMGYAAADCLAPDGRFDLDKWQEYRRSFDEHVVED